MNTKLRWLVPWTVLACALAAALAGGVGASSSASARPDAVYGTPSAPDKLSPQLRQRVDRADPATLLPAIVVMAAQADVSAARHRGPPRPVASGREPAAGHGRLDPAATCSATSRWSVPGATCRTSCPCGSRTRSACAPPRTCSPRSRDDPTWRRCSPT